MRRDSSWLGPSMMLPGSMHTFRVAQYSFIQSATCCAWYAAHATRVCALIFLRTNGRWRGVEGGAGLRAGLLVMRPHEVVQEGGVPGISRAVVALGVRLGLPPRRPAPACSSTHYSDWYSTAAARWGVLSGSTIERRLPASQCKKITTTDAEVARRVQGLAP